MRILITGSRNFKDRDLMFMVLHQFSEQHKEEEVTIVHGKCPTGADRLAGEVARELGYKVEEHPANWEQYGKSAGPIRNQAMVDLGADVCYGFPLGLSRGTRHCMERARKAGIKTYTATLENESRTNEDSVLSKLHEAGPSLFADPQF